MMERDAQTTGAPPDVVDPLLVKLLNKRFRLVEALATGGFLIRVNRALGHRRRAQAARVGSAPAGAPALDRATRH